MDAITRRTRPPISAERMTLASATRSGRSEISSIYLGKNLCAELRADLFGHA